ncbi:MAG: glutamine synthetase [Pseudomonadota bacterium]|nr:glutamine synthetase [Pseudomonadota bacterium]
MGYKFAAVNEFSEPRSRDEMDAWLNENEIIEIECLISDLTGVPRGKIIPRSKFTHDNNMRMPQSVISATVTGNWPDDAIMDQYIAEIDKDMFLVPDVSTVRKVPWTSESVAQVIHDCHFEDGTPVDYAPRNLLKKIIKLYADKGWEAVLAPEVEFYLVDKNIDPDIPLRLPIGRSGRAETARQHYSIDAVNEFDALFNDLYSYCEAMNLDLDTLIHEVGAGQMEVNFLHGNPLKLADKVFYFKRALREVALKHDMYATFMAKPMEWEPGSAMHLHQSVLDKKTGKNIFSNSDGSPSKEFYWYIGGLQKFVPSATAFFAPYVNSYRRLSRFTSAPINVKWGVDNRTVGFRIPSSNADNRRVENRVIGSDANPYVACAVSLACGYLGLINQIEPSSEELGNAYDSVCDLPESLNEAVRALDECPELEELLGMRFCGIYKAVKLTEYAEFTQVISSWEREHLLLHV